MAKNIEINIKGSDGNYEVLYPKTNSSISVVSDEVITNLGLTSDSNVNDALKWFSKYNLYWWKRRTNGSAWHPVYGSTSTVTVCASEDESMVKFRYADEIEISDSGVVSLKNPVEVNSPYSNYTELNQHKFFQTGVYPGQDYNSNVYYVPERTADATRNYSDSTFYVYKTAGVVTSEYSQSIGDWEYVQSSNRNAYPDSGIQDGYEYEYLGVPFDNMVIAGKIETGSYVGTGEFGAENPNTLTFGFVPKFVIFVDNGYYNGSTTYYESLFQRARNLINCELLPDSYGDSAYFLGPLGYSGSKYTDWKEAAWKTNGGKTINWLSTNSAAYQFNEINHIYYYIAIG